MTRAQGSFPPPKKNWCFFGGEVPGVTLPETKIAHENLHFSWQIPSKWWIFDCHVSFREVIFWGMYAVWMNGLCDL